MLVADEPVLHVGAVAHPAKVVDSLVPDRSEFQISRGGLRNALGRLAMLLLLLLLLLALLLLQSRCGRAQRTQPVIQLGQRALAAISSCQISRRHGRRQILPRAVVVIGCAAAMHELDPHRD